ncbi:MAG TPA: 23S rRNA (pseudouridine(1915)-N(3))-methyltransferase RlmH [Lentimicrobium sp.]|nr:23S rRNA (pseudouridine(1915)-N(3))-methyltransferase RlmH [Lentimicrobium sp.]
MKITLLAVGKTDQSYLKEGIKVYFDRLKHYIKFEAIEVETPKSFKSLSPVQLKENEGKLLIKHFEDADIVVLLDEKGSQYSSEEFAFWLQKTMNSGVKNLMFVIGGAYGFSPEVYANAKGKLSLSSMTYSHQIIRLFFAEQLYRAFTILKNEPYHNP